MCAPFISLEPGLGSRPVEPESILPKRLSRRDSGFIQENQKVKELIPEVILLGWNPALISPVNTSDIPRLLTSLTP